MKGVGGEPERGFDVQVHSPLASALVLTGLFAVSSGVNRKSIRSIGL